MDINEYQDKIKEYVNYPKEIGPYSTILALMQDTGKLSEKLNNTLINDRGSFDKKSSLNVLISLGDILFDICNMTSDLGYTMNDVISLNLMKHTKNAEEKNKL